MSLHHQADQSYRIPRRARAERTQQATTALLNAGAIVPAQLLDAPRALLGGDGAVAVDIQPGYSQPVAMAQHGSVGVLIFGSANRPGGGWLNGAKAQEEDISLGSTWAGQASLAPDGFYAHQRGLGGMGPDKVLIAKGAWLVDVDGADLAAPRKVVFAGVAAPNLANPETAKAPRGEVIDRLARRLAGALLAWEDRGVSCAVMGAIGCGVFQWPAQDSAQALRMALNHYREVGQGGLRVVLAMPDPALALAFKQGLAHTGRRQPQR